MTLSPDGRRSLDEAESDLLTLIATYRDGVPGAIEEAWQQIPADSYSTIVMCAVGYIVRLAQPAAATSDLFGSLLDEMRLR